MRVVFRRGGPVRGPGGKKIAALGVFDGVHRGHQKILSHVVREARARCLPSAVITFSDHPSLLFKPHDKVPALTCLEHKLDYFQQAGIDLCYVLRFDRALARMEAEDFVRGVLLEEIGIASLCVGEDFVFGRGCEGDIRLLGRLARECRFRLHVLKRLKVKNRIISSTLIRRLIRGGRLDLAKTFLGRAVSFLGEVVRGEGRGRTLGFPTANIRPFHEVLAPCGIWATEVVLGGKIYPSVTYIGHKPTFHRAGASRCIEVFLIGVRRRLYGKKIEVRFLKKIRNDKKFSSSQSLILQINDDLTAAKKIFKRRLASSPLFNS